jgi:hypothetical protein
MLAKARLDPDKVRVAELAAERKWGPDWRLKRLDSYFAEMLGADAGEPVLIVPQDFAGQWFVVQTEPQREKTVAAGPIGRGKPIGSPVPEPYVPMRRGEPPPVTFPMRRKGGFFPRRVASASGAPSHVHFREIPNLFYCG